MSADLRRADLKGAVSRGTYFTDADLADADFTDVDLTDADFRRANLDGTNFRNAILKRAKGVPLLM